MFLKKFLFLMPRCECVADPARRKGNYPLIHQQTRFATDPSPSLPSIVSAAARGILRSNSGIRGRRPLPAEIETTSVTNHLLHTKCRAARRLPRHTHTRPALFEHPRGARKSHRKSLGTKSGPQLRGTAGPSNAPSRLWESIRRSVGASSSAWADAWAWSFSSFLRSPCG